ncbi:serine hydrolase domain-containing protein [Actinospongicola halichondriae]|uniref:serine hydrolase domain-containing protein n=1 Tax=Actinospongicola halichondriae TaxID=3236844 RepID=UPI003D435C27
MVSSDTSALDAEEVEGLRSRIDHDVERGLVHGAQLAIAVDGDVRLFDHIGASSPGQVTPLYSASKVLPVLATWRLIGDGELTYDRKVVDVLPWFTGGGKDDVTVDHLLLHTAGLPRAPLGPGDWGDPGRRREKMASWYVTSVPGAEFAYHATSASWVQAEVLAAVCGTDHVSAIHALVTDPLGLPSFFGIDDTVHDVADLVVVADGDVTVDLGEATFDALLRFNDHEVRRVGVPGAGAYASAADVAMLYQGVLINPGGLWDEGVVADGTGAVRVTADDPLRAASANRTRGFMVAGTDGMAPRRGLPVDAGPRTFGHDGAGGQVAWADPDTGMSVAFLPAGIDPDIVRLTRRSVSVSTRAMRCLARSSDI